MLFRIECSWLPENSQVSQWIETCWKWAVGVAGLALYLRILRQVNGLRHVGSEQLELVGWHFAWEFSGKSSIYLGCNLDWCTCLMATLPENSEVSRRFIRLQLGLIHLLDGHFAWEFSGKSLINLGCNLDWCTCLMATLPENSQVSRWLI